MAARPNFRPSYWCMVDGLTAYAPLESKREFSGGTNSEDDSNQRNKWNGRQNKPKVSNSGERKKRTGNQRRETIFDGKKVAGKTASDNLVYDTWVVTHLGQSHVLVPSAHERAHSPAAHWITRMPIDSLGKRIIEFETRKQTRTGEKKTKRTQSNA